MRKKNLSLTLLGDIFLGGDLTKFWYETEAFNPFEELKKKLSKTELIYANIEDTFYQGPLRPHRSGHLWAPPASVESLKTLGLSVAGLANNHIMDFGYSAFIRTQQLLHSKGIRCIGAGFSISEASRGCVINKKGWKIGFLAFTTRAFHVNSIVASSSSVGCAPMTDRNLEKSINRMKSRVDVLCIGLHWGYEFCQVPHIKQRKLASKIIEMGADVIAGTHPHVVQGYEIINDCPVFYSLGNLIFPEYERIDGLKQKWEPINNYSIMATIRIAENGDGYKLTPNIVPLKFCFPYVKLLEPKENAEFLKKMNILNSAIIKREPGKLLASETHKELKKRNIAWCRIKLIKKSRLFIIDVISILLGPYRLEKLKNWIRKRH